MSAVTAYPLCWPAGKRRSEGIARSNFKTHYDKSLKLLKIEVERLEGTDLVISSNIQIRRDGFPMAGRPPPSDCGAAIYFQRKGKRMAFACDRWDSVQHNIHSIYLTIQALRGIERWGSGEMMEAAFTGFTALPAPEQWFTILGVSFTATREQILSAHRRLAMVHHPDRGGADYMMARINSARDEGLAQR